MSEPALVYLEADDEITTVVRRLRAADAPRVVVVAPGRSRATSSAVALRLLARVGAETGREVVVVGDALTRSLAAEATLPAFASVEEARAAVLGDEAGPAREAPRRAAIHVVRGARTDETADRPAVVAEVPPPRAAAAGSSDETLAVPLVPRPAAEQRHPARLRRPARGLAAVLGIAGALLVAGIVAGATLLPAATIVIEPRAVPVTRTYEMIVEEPERHGDTVEARATVTATGTYEVLTSATGVVTFRNFNIGAVEVLAGSLVAAGEQAFEVTEAVVVPSGSLTASGTIAAGEADAPVAAAAPGPAANVEADAIDTVLSQGVAAQLRGFPQNNARLVLNAEPTGGGADATGPEITEGDVESAVEELRAELRRQVESERPELAGLQVVEEMMGEPDIDVPEDLAGTRDVAEAEIAGSLTWSLVAVDLDAIEEEAAGRLASDPALPAEHDLLADTLTVSLGEPTLDGDEVTVEATVRAMSVPRLDEGTVRALATGRSEAEAELALSGYGRVDVVLWPGWVESVPETEWRVEIRVEEEAP